VCPTLWEQYNQRVTNGTLRDSRGLKGTPSVPRRGSDGEEVPTRILSWKELYLLWIRQEAANCHKNQVSEPNWLREYVHAR
jgi:hypothetical protein